MQAPIACSMQRAPVLRKAREGHGEAVRAQALPRGHALQDGGRQRGGRALQEAAACEKTAEACSCHGGKPSIGAAAPALDRQPWAPPPQPAPRAASPGPRARRRGGWTGTLPPRWPPPPPAPTPPAAHTGKGGGQQGAGRTEKRGRQLGVQPRGAALHAGRSRPAAGRSTARHSTAQQRSAQHSSRAEHSSEAHSMAPR